ncbi:leucine-rich repeat-containing protein 9-like [Topomyia yanbarensis]|uniref:leucine-rich repeat-containing protein 9-like n=1 Tax=Topomyia yanbarensis TaxID=2498891 RepID=UPI00273B3CCB|nr:leucine-rich repeat-containing protein 9-like [Topomyia yanbarensis]
MGKMFQPAWLCILFAAVIVSAEVSINCEGQTNCRVLGQNPQDIQTALRNYPSAKQVDLHGNLLESFDGFAVQNLNGLQVLNLSYNLLQADVLKKIKNTQLKIVDLTYNQLSIVSIPASVNKLIATRNKLHNLVIPSFNQLQELHLSMNKLDSLRDLRNARSLTSLDVSCNHIRALEFEELSRMPSLTTLNLANNYINVIVGNVPLPNLKYLDLSNNLLTIMDGLFNYMPELTELQIPNNKIVMTLDTKREYPKLSSVHLSGNDWYCKSLTEFLGKNPQVTSKPDRVPCTAESFKNVCCSNAASPFADRLIQYRFQKFKALEIGTAQRVSGINCADYKPNPCDGDDSLVYKVASSTVQDAQFFARSQLQEIQNDLRRSQNRIDNARRSNQTLHADIAELNSLVKDLDGFVNREYQIAGLEGEKETSKQLRNIFQQYDTDYGQLKAQINAEERDTGSKLTEVTAIESQLQELRERQEKLTEDIGKRNRTVTGYLAQIEGLNKRIQGTRLN